MGRTLGSYENIKLHGIWATRGWQVSSMGVVELIEVKIGFRSLFINLSSRPYLT